MEDQIYPTDQTQVLFTDKNGVSREGKYVAALHAYVELPEAGTPQDCSNVYPETDIVRWDFLERSKPHEGNISIL